MIFEIWYKRASKLIRFKNLAWKEFEPEFDSAIDEIKKNGEGYVSIGQIVTGKEKGYATINGADGFFVINVVTAGYEIEALIVNPLLKNPEDQVDLSYEQSSKKYATDNLDAGVEMMKILYKTGKVVDIEPNIWLDGFCSG